MGRPHDCDHARPGLSSLVPSVLLRSPPCLAVEHFYGKESRRGIPPAAESHQKRRADDMDCVQQDTWQDVISCLKQW